MAFKARNDVSWHDESISGIWGKKFYIAKLLKNVLE